MIKSAIAVVVMFIVTKGIVGVIIAEILDAVNQTFDFAPRSIIHKFDLKHTRYLPYACFGHFGRIECNSPWEQLDKVEELKTIFNFEKEN